MTSTLRHHSLIALLLWALGACGPTASADDQSDAAVSPDGGTVPMDGTTPNQDGTAPPTDGFVPPDANCGAQTEEIALINLGDPPDMLIVMDRSGSMLLPPGWPPAGDSKWQIMKTSLSAVLAAREANIRFGLSAFATDDYCGVDPGARVPIDLNNADEISLWLNNNGPSANTATPAHLALIEALAIYQSIPANPAGRYVLLATDGVPNCGGSPADSEIYTETETLQAVSDLAAAGIHTFVLGFGGLLGINPQLLNDAAVAGLEPQAGGPPYYYPAENAQELQDALDTIAGGIILPSCSYQLVDLPPVPDDVSVYFDGVAVPRSPGHFDGWDYHPDAGTITFFGTYCDSLMNGGVSAVNFVYGCPGPEVL